MAPRSKLTKRISALLLKDVQSAPSKSCSETLESRPEYRAAAANPSVKKSLENRFHHVRRLQKDTNKREHYLTLLNWADHIVNSPEAQHRPEPKEIDSSEQTDSPSNLRSAWGTDQGLTPSTSTPSQPAVDQATTPATTAPASTPARPATIQHTATMSTSTNNNTLVGTPGRTNHHANLFNDLADAEERCTDSIEANFELPESHGHGIHVHKFAEALTIAGEEATVLDDKVKCVLDNIPDVRDFGLFSLWLVLGGTALLFIKPASPRYLSTEFQSLLELEECMTEEKARELARELQQQSAWATSVAQTPERRLRHILIKMPPGVVLTTDFVNSFPDPPRRDRLVPPVLRELPLTVQVPGPTRDTRVEVEQVIRHVYYNIRIISQRPKELFVREAQVGNLYTAMQGLAISRAMDTSADTDTGPRSILHSSARVGGSLPRRSLLNATPQRTQCSLLPPPNQTLSPPAPTSLHFPALSPPTRSPILPGARSLFMPKTLTEAMFSRGAGKPAAVPVPVKAAGKPAEPNVDAKPAAVPAPTAADGAAVPGAKPAAVPAPTVSYFNFVKAKQKSRSVGPLQEYRSSLFKATLDAQKKRNERMEVGIEKSREKRSNHANKFRIQAGSEAEAEAAAGMASLFASAPETQVETVEEEAAAAAHRAMDRERYQDISDTLSAIGNDMALDVEELQAFHSIDDEDDATDKEQQVAAAIVAEDNETSFDTSCTEDIGYV